MQKHAVKIPSHLYFRNLQNTWERQSMTIVFVLLPVKIQNTTFSPIKRKLCKKKKAKARIEPCAWSDKYSEFDNQAEKSIWDKLKLQGANVIGNHPSEFFKTVQWLTETGIRTRRQDART